MSPTLSLDSQITGCWDNPVYRVMNLAYVSLIRGTVVNGRFDIDLNIEMLRTVYQIV